MLLDELDALDKLDGFDELDEPVALHELDGIRMPVDGVDIDAMEAEEAVDVSEVV